MLTEATPPVPAIPDYELLRLIGRGAYGEVWLARGVTGVYRAVKIVWRERFVDAGPYEREFHGLKQFAEISLHESRQLALLHVGRDPAAGYFYYVMELADDVATGRAIDPPSYAPLTLKEMRIRRGRLPANECIGLGVELARALAGLHARGLVHRDIKPSNVIIVGGAPKLADIGLVTEASAALTFVGTEGFVPPEGPGAPSADVFALGKLLYEMATGLDRHDYPRLPAELHGWPDRKEVLELNEIIIRACEPHPGRRHVDATALLDDLLLLQAGRSVRQLRRAERRVTRALRLGALLALVAAIAGLGAYLERQRANQEMAGRLSAEAERDALARRAVYSAALTQAQRALEQEDYGRARRFLDEVTPKSGEPDLREFEWQALRQDAAGDHAVVLKAAGAPGQQVAFSRDGAWLFAQNTNAELTAWPRSTLQEKPKIPGVSRIGDVSRDGLSLIGNDGFYALRRWSLTNGQAEPAASNNRDWLLGRLRDEQWLSYIPGGNRPLFLRGWDFATNRELWKKAIPHTGGPGDDESGNYLSAALSPDGTLCAIGLIHGRAQGARWRVMVLSLPDMGIRWERMFDHRPAAFAFGPTADTLACGWGDTGDVGLLDLSSGEWRWQTKSPLNQLRTLVLVGNDRLAVGGRSSQITLLDLATGKPVAARRGQESDVVSLAYSSATQELLSTGSGGDVRLWSLQEPVVPRTLEGLWSPAGGGRALCLADNGRLLAATAALRVVRVLRTDTGEAVAQFNDSLAPVAFDPDQQRLWLMTASKSLVAQSLDAARDMRRRIDLPIQPFIATATPDCRRVACLDTNGSLVLIDTETGRVSPVIPTKHPYPWWVALSADGSRAATFGVDALVRIWDVATGKMLAERKPASETSNGAFSPDGRLIAFAQNTGNLEVWDVGTQKTVAKLTTSSGILQGIAFDAHSPRLFLGGREGTVHVIDTVRWQEVTQLRTNPVAQPGTVSRIAMSADGGTLAGYTESGTIRLWRK